MENILVPIDFSEVSNNALDYAIKLAEPLKCKITLFHSVYPILVATDVSEFVYPYNLEAETKAILNKKMDELVQLVEGQGLSAKKIIHKGILKDEISDFVRNEKIDLIVTGTDGAKGIEAFLFGTNSEHIFETVKCPVLMIPANMKFSNINKIMYATDFQYGDIHEIENISKIAQIFNAQIIVTHINSDPKKIIVDEESMNWLAEITSSRVKYKNIIYKIISNQYIIEALEHAVKDLNIDILCMSVIKKNLFQKIFSKSNTKEMAFQTTIPLMSIHLDNRIDHL